MRAHIAVLNMGWVRVELAQRLMEVVITQRAYPLSLEFSGIGVERRPIASNRNRIVRDTPEDAEVLVMIDADCIPPLNFLDAVDPELDIVGLPMPIWCSGEIYTGIVPLDSAEMQPVGAMELVECKAVAAGVMFIARRVFTHPEMQFVDEFDGDGVLTSTEDHVYCDKARALGFRVWANLGYPLAHVKEIDLQKVWVMMAEARGGV